GGQKVMHQVATAADRIDYWIRRRIVTCAAPGNASPASDRYVGLTAAIGQSLSDQYDALAAPVPSHLATLVKRLQSLEGRRNNELLWCLRAQPTPGWRVSTALGKADMPVMSLDVRFEG